MCWLRLNERKFVPLTGGARRHGQAVDEFIAHERDGRDNETHTKRRGERDGGAAPSAQLCSVGRSFAPRYVCGSGLRAPVQSQRALYPDPERWLGDGLRHSLVLRDLELELVAAGLVGGGGGEGCGGEREPHHRRNEAGFGASSQLELLSSCRI